MLCFVKINFFDRGVDTRSPTSLAMIVGILSGPAAFRCLIAFNIELLSTVRNFISFRTGLVFCRQLLPGLQIIFLDKFEAAKVKCWLKACRNKLSIGANKTKMILPLPYVVACLHDAPLAPFWVLS